MPYVVQCQLVDLITPSCRSREGGVTSAGAPPLIHHPPVPSFRFIQPPPGTPLPTVVREARRRHFPSRHQYYARKNVQSLVLKVFF